MVYSIALIFTGQPWAGSVNGFAWIIVAGVALEAFGLVQHARYLRSNGGEGMASHYEQCTKFGMTYLFRNTGLAISMLLLVLIGLLNPDGNVGLLLWVITAAVIAVTAVIGRALFYALVIPTTMPGGFFWHNKGFEEHARETGLAEMPQAGVLPDCH